MEEFNFWEKGGEGACSKRGRQCCSEWLAAFPSDSQCIYGDVMVWLPKGTAKGLYQGSWGVVRL